MPCPSRAAERRYHARRCRHQRRLHATEGGNFTRLRHAGRRVTRKVCSLSRVEQQRTPVLKGDGVGTVRETGVNEGVVQVRVVICRLVDRLLEVEADADDQVTAVGDHGLNVGRKVRVGAGLGRVDLNTQLALGILQSVVR